ncbi:MAG: TonB-dependent receptor [Gallionella sp.]|nr:TonB-dependent receptor [Gallionella sp.]
MNFFTRLLRYRPLFSVLFASLAASGVWAADFASEQEYLQELPVVLSASRLSQPLSETPNAVTVINRAMIEASGFRAISDLFRLVPGMYVGYESGHAPIVAYHGSTEQYSRRMQVLVDGRSVYLPPFSSVNWEDIPLHIDDIERIEVVRGPAAASHGANSFQGVINIITRDASNSGGTRVAVAWGNGGIADVSAHLGKTGTDVDYRATLAYRSDNGFDTSVLNDGNVTRLANLRVNYHPNSSDSFDLQLGYNEGVRDEGVAEKPSDPFGEIRTYSNFQQVSWLRALPQFDEIKLNYYHIYRNSKDYQYSTAGNVNVHRHELELQHTVHLTASNRLVWGGGMRADSAAAAYAMSTQQTLHQSRLFAHDEWRVVESAVLNAGAMLENDGMGHRNTSPRVSLNYHLASQHTVRAGTSVAYRSPSILEEKIDIPGKYVSLGRLRPEKIHSKEIGYLGEFKTLGVTVDARAYFDRVSDIIYYDPSPLGPPAFDGKPYSLSNLLSADYRGVEGTLKYRWAERSDLTFNFSRQYASCSATGTLREPLFAPILQDIADSCSSMVPRNSGSILLTQQTTDNVLLSAGYYHQGKLQFLDSQAPLSIMRRLDLRAAKTFGKPVADGGGEVALVVQNALRDDYTEYAASPQATGKIFFNRRIYLTAKVGF